MHEDYIQNFESFIFAKFIGLESLDLTHNKLRNDCIMFLYQLKFKKLKELNLYLIDITDSNVL